MATKTKRKPTEAEKAQAEQRRERFKGIVKRIADMSEDARMEFMGRGQIKTAAGAELSVFNSCLVLMQSGTATQVGGFLQWKALGRKVRKGQAGLMIWIPTKGRKADTAAVDGEAATDATTGRAGFVMGYVWDIGQTEEIVDGE